MFLEEVPLLRYRPRLRSFFPFSSFFVRVTRQLSWKFHERENEETWRYATVTDPRTYICSYASYHRMRRDIESPLELHRPTLL